MNAECVELQWYLNMEDKKCCDRCGIKTNNYLVIEENPAKILCNKCLSEWMEEQKANDNF